jgi:hypothetical protein
MVKELFEVPGEGVQNHREQAVLEPGIQLLAHGLLLD